MTVYIWNTPTSCPCLNEYLVIKFHAIKIKQEKIENNANPDNESQMSVICVPGILLGHMNKL